MAISGLTRREFLELSGAVAATAVIAVSCDSSNNQDSAPLGTMTVFCLSLRGRRGSRAAKSHNANKGFATRRAADQNRAHPGDNSRIVSKIVSEARFNQLFTNGTTTVADRRDF